MPVSRGRAARFATVLLAFCTFSAPTVAGDIDVVVTIKPIHSLVSQVMAGIATPKLIVDGASSPHTFSLKPSDARALASADVVFRVSPALEAFSDRLAGVLKAEAQMVSLAESPGVSLLMTRTGATFEAHGHAAEGGREDHADHAKHTDHAGHDADRHKDDAGGRGHHHADSKDDSDHHGEHHGGADTHVWLDPANAKAIVRHVAAVLAARMPERKAALDANAASAIAAIDVLDRELAGILAPVAGKPFVVFHDAYQYFERHYGLAAAGSITLHPEVRPSARRISEIRDRLKKLSSACVFTEPQFPSRIIAAVTEGTGTRTGVLDPIGAAVLAGADHYGAMMRLLAAGLATCLAGG
ncbi:MAG: zinc ABC transporter substrate-binding protein [Hyphomicrobiaceae bacterium]|nr:zinc ABC transporter substrate-binding protein [Hyphomicrobiaceae bacterium]